MATQRSFGMVAAIAAALATLVIGVYALPPEMKMTMAQNLERRLAGLRLGSVARSSGRSASIRSTSGAIRWAARSPRATPPLIRSR